LYCERSQVQKLVLKLLQAADEADLRSLAETLSDTHLDHKLWIEQPENTPTCLVLKPYAKNDVQKFLKKYKLFK